MYFHDLRRRYRISQKKLANLMGYEQAYVSSVELGKKGPPNDEFVTRLIQALHLDANEQATLFRAVEESQRRYGDIGDRPPFFRTAKTTDVGPVLC